MKHEELLDPTNLPDDLKWLVSEYRLHPDDPVFLLVAWHWSRISRCEDTVRAAIAELKAAMDSRIATVTDAAATMRRVHEAFAALQSSLDEKPSALAAQLEAEVRQPLISAIESAHSLEKTLRSQVNILERGERRQILAALLIGVTLGVLGAIIILLA